MPEATDLLVERLTRVARDGAGRAGRGLSGLMGQQIAIYVPAVRLGSRADACEAVGGDETVVLGAYFEMTGRLAGHLLLLFPVNRALECVDIMCGRPMGSTRRGDELVDSTIGELGNIVGSAFVNAFGDFTGLVLQATPPTVVNDLANALVESVYAEILAGGGEVAMLDTVFEDHRGRSAGLLMAALDPACLPLFRERAA